MTCHECSRDGTQCPAVAVCKYCCVGLCKAHLMESYRQRPSPQYACNHQPDR